MKTIFNRVIPFKGFLAVSVFGLIFVRKEYEYIKGTPVYERMLRHEAIHNAQMKELGYIPFYIIYFFEWLFDLVRYGLGGEVAYLSISFEKEAYRHQDDTDYLQSRQHYAQWR